MRETQMFEEIWKDSTGDIGRAGFFVVFTNGFFLALRRMAG